MMRNAFAASEKGETSISLSISLAGSLSENDVAAIFTVERESSNATSSQFVRASVAYHLPYLTH